MIVDGASEFTGSDTGKAVNAVMEAAKTPKATVELTKNEGRIGVKIAGLPAHEKATVYLAIAEDGLSSQIGAGENRGRKLEHMAVVRHLKAVGSIEPSAKDFQTEIEIALDSAWKRENVRFVVFVQDNASRRILGVNRISAE